jgi:hypothetical protein
VIKSNAVATPGTCQKCGEKIEGYFVIALCDECLKKLNDKLDLAEVQHGEEGNRRAGDAQHEGEGKGHGHEGQEDQKAQGV